MIIMPTRPIGEEDDKKTAGKAEEKSKAKLVKTSDQPVKKAAPGSGSLFIGIILIILGGIFLIENFPFFQFHPFYWFKRHFWEYFLPGILIVTGIVLLVKSSEKK
jgi:hypothetical protein